MALAVGFALTATPALLVIGYLLRSSARARALHVANSETARRNAALVEASGEGVLELDDAGLVRYANPAAARMLGYAAEELLGADYRELVQSIGLDLKTAEFARTRHNTDVRRGIGAALRCKDGRVRPVVYRVVPMQRVQYPGSALLTFADVSESVRLDAMLTDMQVLARVGAWQYLPDGDRLSGTPEAHRMLDLPADAPLDRRAISAMYDEADRARLETLWRTALETGQGFEMQARLNTQRGRAQWIHIIANAERFNGRTYRLYGAIQDITQQRLSEQELRETRDFFARTLDSMPALVMYVNVDGVATYCNRQATQSGFVVGGNIVGRRLQDLLDGEFYARLAPRIEAAIAGLPQSFTATGKLDQRSVEWRIHLIPEIKPHGDVSGFYAVMQDLSEMKRLEARLAHAEKMEALGQLTGGIAHDFNNLLGVVIGNLQLLERAVCEHPEQSRKVQAAMRAALRGANLTRRLLAFARRQVLEPEVLDVGKQLRGFEELLRSTLGDAIQIHIECAEGLWATRADPGQVENAIINLAINARDAMPDGGQLTISADNCAIDAEFCADHPGLEPGDYVRIVVRDTGAGIAPEILPHVFEPFFTTKDVGKGSGLGLPMVLGFAKQSGGTAVIESKLARGSAASIFLPRHSEAVEREQDASPYSFLSPRGYEKILLVEDDPELRETLAAHLQAFGYDVVQAHDAEHALAILRQNNDVDLLFTDVTMPGGDMGPTLAQRARALRPSLNVLFAAGRPSAHEFVGDAGLSRADVVTKPFRTDELARRVRYLLDREARFG